MVSKVDEVVRAVDGLKSDARGLASRVDSIGRRRADATLRAPPRNVGKLWAGGAQDSDAMQQQHAYGLSTAKQERCTAFQKGELSAAIKANQAAQVGYDKSKYKYPGDDPEYQRTSEVRKKLGDRYLELWKEANVEAKSNYEAMQNKWAESRKKG